jgi:predicted DCC family thiol-disulfide oxidoreductase YuxK
VAAQTLIGKTLVLYDGVCGLCNGIVRFLLRFDNRDQFRYAALQSEFAAEVVRKHGLNPAELDSVVVVTSFGQPDEGAHTKFDAVIASARDLGGIWRIGSLARVLPGWLRNRFYDLIARNRYRMFGRYDTCPIPKPEHRVKFVDHIEAKL